jgi:cytoskeletal protein RodZ
MGNIYTVRQDLSALRLKRGISLTQISETTKIGLRYLEAIEHNDFGKLPGGIYTLSYIRQYARAIKVNEQELLDRYRQTASIS